MHKTALHISTALLLLTAVSCQEQLIERCAEGMIAVRIENSPALEIVTKAEGTEVNTDDFNVYVTSDRGMTEYVYNEVKGGIPVISGTYAVAADNVTEEESLVTPDQWGQVRYYGISARKDVPVGDVPVEFSIVCRMVNSAVSVAFDKSVTGRFADYKVTAYTVPGRRLTFGKENTSQEAVAYFSPATLCYEFTGITADEKVITYSGTSELSAATHLKLTFKVADSSGSIGLDIKVNADYEVVPEIVPIDPKPTE